MRVISGTARGMKLFSPVGDKTRPTEDRIKEAIFNIIAADVPGAIFLDLFAGTGAVGIEALSRGAAEVVFVEHSPACAEVIKKNLNKARFTDSGQIITADVLRAVRTLHDKGRVFDIIFMDPPYGFGLAAKTITEITGRNILKDAGFIIAEHVGDEPLNEGFLGFETYKTKRYARTVLDFLRKGGDYTDDSDLSGKL